MRQTGALLSVSALALLLVLTGVFFVISKNQNAVVSPFEMKLATTPAPVLTSSNPTHAINDLIVPRSMAAQPSSPPPYWLNSSNYNVTLASMLPITIATSIPIIALLIWMMYPTHTLPHNLMDHSIAYSSAFVVPLIILSICYIIWWLTAKPKSPSLFNRILATFPTLEFLRHLQDSTIVIYLLKGFTLLLEVLPSVAVMVALFYFSREADIEDSPAMRFFIPVYPITTSIVATIMLLIAFYFEENLISAFIFILKAIASLSIAQLAIYLLYTFVAPFVTGLFRRAQPPNADDQELNQLSRNMPGNVLSNQPPLPNSRQPFYPRMGNLQPQPPPVDDS